MIGWFIASLAPWAVDWSAPVPRFSIRCWWRCWSAARPGGCTGRRSAEGSRKQHGVPAVGSGAQRQTADHEHGDQQRVHPAHDAAADRMVRRRGAIRGQSTRGRSCSATFPDPGDRFNLRAESDEPEPGRGRRRGKPGRPQELDVHDAGLGQFTAPVDDRWQRGCRNWPICTPAVSPATPEFTRPRRRGCSMASPASTGCTP